MKLRNLLLACAASLAFSAAGAHANTVIDDTGVWTIGYVGPHEDDLDITSFSASFNPSQNAFDLRGTFLGNIDPTLAGSYVIGANTGTGASHPFAAQGAPNVVFNQAIIIQKTGAATLGANTLTAQIDGSGFSLEVPLADLPSTGFTNPYDYQFNLWSKSASQIADFAPNNSDLTAVPEPGAWALMLVGVGLVGATLRRRRAMAPAMA
jgi:hypothetical protein